MRELMREGIREPKFRYVWERPKRYYGPYSPSDVRYKYTYLSLSEIEEGKCKPPDRKYILVVAKQQFIGHRDEDGVEIYEGNVVLDDKGHRCLVEWDDIMTGFHPFHRSLQPLLRAYKVIDDTYSNPKLLGGEDE